MVRKTIKRMARMRAGVQIAPFLSLSYRPMLIEIRGAHDLVALGEVVGVDGRAALNARKHLDDREYSCAARPESFNLDESNLLPAGIYCAAWYECGKLVYIMIDEAHRCLARAPFTAPEGMPSVVRELSLIAELHQASERATVPEQASEPEDDDDLSGEEWKRPL